MIRQKQMTMPARLKGQIKLYSEDELKVLVGKRLQDIISDLKYMNKHEIKSSLLGVVDLCNGCNYSEIGE